jgi:hypothetical protein
VSFVALQLPKMKPDTNANIRLMENALNPSRSNRFRVLTGLARRYTVGTVTVLASALASPALANTITFETAPLGAGFTGPIIEDGFAYSTLSGGLLINHFGNPGRDAESNQSLGGGVLEIVSATGGDFNFNALDFAAFDLFRPGSQTLTVEGFIGGSSVGVDQYTLANTNDVSKGTYANWTTEAASVLAGKTIFELRISLTASSAGTGFTFGENIDNVLLTPVLAAIPEPSSLILLGAAAGAGFIRLRRRRLSAASPSIDLPR